MSMHIVSGGRQVGKTTAMIRMAAETNAYIICPDRRQVEHVWRMAQEMGVSIPFPMRWAEFVDGQYHGRGIRGFIIDNLDQCIQQMATVPIFGASVSIVDSIPLPEDGGSDGHIHT